MPSGAARAVSSAPEAAAGAWTIIDDYRLAEACGEFVREAASHRVHPASGCDWCNQTHGARRIGLARRCGG